jgi:hypothetical protein
LLAAVVGLALSAAPCAAADPALSSPRQNGAVDGLWYWRVPGTPNALRPNQSWSGAGVTPDGGVYLGGMDHATNAALYRLRHGRLRYVGDARAASESAGNWLAGESAEKFHTRPTWYRGRVWVATMNASTPDDAYRSERGFKWYAYRPGGRLIDLSAREPGGSGLPHGGLVTLAVDRRGGFLYGAVHPTGELVRYDVAAATTTRLGRPHYGRPYVYPGRFMWVDGRGRVYFTAGNDELRYYGAPYDPAVFNHVRYYDPSSGFGEMPEWSLHDQRAIDNGQCFPEDGVCYLADNVGNVYRFREAGPSFEYLGSGVGHRTSSDEYTWVFHVAPDQTTAWLLNTAGRLFEFDLASGARTLLADLGALDPLFASERRYYGAGAWSRGRFYFATFGNPPADDLYLSAIDPVRLKRALAER